MSALAYPRSLYLLRDLIYNLVYIYIYIYLPLSGLYNIVYTLLINTDVYIYAGLRGTVQYSVHVFLWITRVFIMYAI